MMSEFKTGDVVRLKSGGQAMTVEKADANGVTCNWWAFEAKGDQLRMRTFHTDMLVRYEKPNA